MDLPQTNVNTGHRLPLGPHEDTAATGGNGGHAGHLSESHRRALFEESGISPAIVSERGYRTVTRRRELEEFPEWQRRLGLYVPIHSPDGETTRCQLRPDKRRRGGPKYETPQDSDYILDCHPRMMAAVRDPGRDLWVTEGSKKVDALATHGEPCIGLVGVHMFAVAGTEGKVPLPCWAHVPLEGRTVRTAFDSDYLEKEGVQLALERLVTMLEALGARVLVCYLPAGEDGSKVGVDDYLAAGGTVEELEALARPYQPSELGRIRLSRDEKLRALVEDLGDRYWAFDWNAAGGDTAQDVTLKLIEAAQRHGKIHPDGIRVVKAQGPLALEAKISSRTLWKCLNRLEEWGILYRDNDGREVRKPGAFVLRASVSHKGRRDAAGSRESGACGPGDLHLRAPRLMCSRPKYKPTKKMIREHRLGNLSVLPEPREGIKRLAKKRGHLFDALDAAGGTLTLEELARATHRKRARDLVRRKTTEKGRDGLLVWPEEAGIVAINGDTVSLSPDWLERLEAERERGEEIQAEEVARRRYKAKSKYFHEHGKLEAIPAEEPPALMGPENVEEIVEARKKEDREARVEHQRQKVGTTAEVFVFDKLKALGRIRLELLMQVYADAGGDPWDIPPAAARLGCRIERLPEYENRQFVFPPMEGVA